MSIAEKKVIADTKKELDCVFIIITPDGENIHIFKEINKIHNHIKKSTKKSLIGDLSKRLLELEFKSNYSIKLNCLKWIVKKHCQIIKNEKPTIKNKTDKN